MRIPRLSLTLLLFLVASFFSASPAVAQEPPMHAGKLAHALDRLANTGRVLYIAAHPDDENTRLLGYLANNRHVSAAYLSMTRGGGGQNLLGTEQAELLDVIRTEELLAARRIDSAQQRFTRMRDFGFSKSASETLEIWDHDEALADVVRVIRTFQPDVIITRFNELPPNHGHHTASAILAREAYSAAADPKRFPDQIDAGLEPWQAERLLLNVPTWTDHPAPIGASALDVGDYDVRLGLGYGELAALSRSQHKSQGFGVAGERGPLIERFLSVAGSKPTKDILEGIDVGWSRFGSRAKPLAAALKAAQAALERDRPERALPALIQAHKALDALPPVVRVLAARTALDEIIAAAAGVFVRATAAQPSAVPGSEVSVKIEVTQRRPAALRLRRVVFPGASEVPVDTALTLEEKKEVAAKISIAADAAVSTPYWLADPSLPGRQLVADPTLIGQPKAPAALMARIELEFSGRTIMLDAPVQYAWTDRVQGERLRDFQVVPPATITPTRQAIMFANYEPTAITLRVRAGRDDLHGDAVLGLPAGWQAQPAVVPVSLAHAGEETTLRFEVTPPKDGAAVSIHPAVEVAGASWSYREDVIDYPHIPQQTVLQRVALRLVPLDVKLPKGRVGYIPGSGDTIAEDLTHIGVAVEVLDDDTIRSGDLSRFAAIVVGIRAYNTRPLLRSTHARLMQYVENGGVVVVQYNTSNRLDPLDTPIGPYPLEIGRDRVTDETAVMEPVDPQQPLLRQPNQITAADFDGWAQERGLYYAQKWDDHYQPIFRAHDPGEDPLLGGLLVAHHGKGRYVYTGLAFFRQLPAGVPGAYRLFLNLLAAD